MYISTVSRSIIYTDKGKADNPQTAEERVFKMKKLILYRVDFDIKKIGEHLSIPTYVFLNQTPLLWGGRSATVSDGVAVGAVGSGDFRLANFRFRQR